MPIPIGLFRFPFKTALCYSLVFAGEFFYWMYGATFWSCRT